LRAYPDMGSMQENQSLDAVLIATPTSMHLEPALRALDAGVHVMLEKPMALDLAGSRRLADLAREKGRILSVFHNRRWDLDYLTVKMHMQAGVFGQVFNVESRLGQWASCVGPAAREYRPGWRNEAAFGGGGLYDWGSHFIDQMWRLFYPARVIRMYAQLRGNVWTRDCDDLARVVMDFEGGPVGVVEINTTTTLPLPRWHIDGTGGSAQSPCSLTFDLNEWARLGFTPAGSDQNRPLAPANPQFNETGIWERFAAACRGEAPPAVSPRSVLVTMMLLDAARTSGERGMSIQTDDRPEWDNAD
jgi:scyllo-inositol 2-dehydrogenase (NADP+)